MIDYEEQRLLNIQRNKEILANLRLGEPTFVLPPATAGVPVKASAPAKRPRLSEPAPKPKKKARRVLAIVKNEGDTSGLRRSSRAAARGISYRDDDDRSVASTPVKKSSRGKKEDDYDESDSEDEEEDEEDEEEDYSRTPQRKAQRLGVRTQDPKQFGAIPGVKVGTWWESRMDCSTAAVHAPTVCGISGQEREGGAYSIALSGGYEDDVDEGYAFTYTGAGGRDLKGTPQNRKNLRTAPQSKDQSFETIYNKALKKSVETKYPVRVVRGFKLDSKFAPQEGYRYDGLYVVEKAWMETGLNPGGFKVCKFAMRRLPDQPPIPVNKHWRSKKDNSDLEEKEEQEETEETEVDEETNSESAEESKENKKKKAVK
ncbi:hypothetical protein CALVIDRAFT_365881 [Calocera viscosa TUFC12733]|uniref:YDG domain-containing protein n=1 Tax=Calocera viscosa (strain TUFC12733) TaxID=1330018 RepID=A0A167H3Z9_CALVF|nr:hypothetical protein CALVIDRAFT_365881 [Calocera viscosa TUFC12733]